MAKIRQNHGFTLIELMIVVVIIGILAAIAVPRYTQVSAQSKQSEAESVLKQMCSLAEIVMMREGAYPAALADIEGWADPGAKYFSFDYAAGVATATAGGGTEGPQSGLVDREMDCATYTSS
jgi:prepilin-type N-terminal cleavage/methylation domain-containing protein